MGIIKHAFEKCHKLPAPPGERRNRMKARGTIAVAAAVASLATAAWGATPAAAATTCIWGGTPAAPTGKFTIEPGLTWTPAARPLKLHATGPAKGDACKRTVTFDGILHAGSTCAAIVFEGVVKGVRGVARFFGPGSGVITHELLYDRDGELVGFNDPSIVTDLVEQIAAGQASCDPPRGFTHGRFSSVITLFE
jgi:hypothetical protein